MADIYDLVQQGLAQTQYGKKKFESQKQPYQDFGLEIIKMLEGNKDRRDIANKDALTNISSLVGKVTTPEGMANINDSLDKLSNESGGNTELDTNIAILKNINQTSLENYNAYKDGIDRGLSYVDSDSFPKSMKEYQNLDQIALNAGFSNEDGTGDTIKYLYGEKEKINSYMDKIGLGFDGKTKKFNYSKGMDSSVIRKLSEHSRQIDVAIKAFGQDGIITKAEAYHIMVGDSKYYEEDRALALAEAKSVYGTAITSSSKIGTLIKKTQLGAIDEDFLVDLESYDISGRNLINEETGELIEGGKKTILEQLQGAQAVENNRAKAANDKYRRWAGRDFDPTMGRVAGYKDDGEPLVLGPPKGESVEVEGTYNEEGNLIAGPTKQLVAPPLIKEEEIENVSEYAKGKGSSMVDKVNELSDNINNYGKNFLTDYWMQVPHLHSYGMSGVSRARSKGYKTRYENFFKVPEGTEITIEMIQGAHEEGLLAEEKIKENKKTISEIKKELKIDGKLSSEAQQTIRNLESENKGLEYKASILEDKGSGASGWRGPGSKSILEHYALMQSTLEKEKEKLNKFKERYIAKV